MTAAIDAFGLTDTGKVRESNQDNFLIVEIRKSVEVQHSSLANEYHSDRFGASGGHLFVVADGVGGGPDGDRASGDTVKALLQYVGETVGCFNAVTASKQNELFERLEETVRKVHENLIETHGGGQGPATTLTMALLIWPRVYVVHVGDSRAYVRRGGKVQQLTRDQTFGQYMVSVGAWTEEQAAISGPGATLTSAVGGSQFEPVVGLIELDEGDSMLLCTDGLTKHVTNDRLAQVLGESTDAQSMTRTLINEALAGGGTDNVSVIVVKTSRNA